MDKRKTILSVDDSPINNKLLEAFLKREHNIQSKESGEEALAWLENNTPDVILLDIMMPEMDGIEMLSLLKADARLKDIPVIMVTAKTEMDSIKTSLNLGAQDYVKKPIDFTELQAKIAVAFKINEQKKDISKYKTYYNIHEGMLHAERIQRSILPDKDTFKKIFSKAFIINLPKHIVGGDFYWLHKHLDKIHIGVFDCTGHGVPAAMLAVIGQMELYNISQNTPDIDTENLFALLSNKFTNFLNKSGDTYTQYEGMDASYCTIFPTEDRMDYVLAKRTFILVRTNNNPLVVNGVPVDATGSLNNYHIYILSGNRCSIGKESKFFNFKMNSLELELGDRIYLFSDGITDQLGGEELKRLKRKEFVDIILGIQEKSMNQQKAAIFNWFEKWKGENEQTDDVILVGFEYDKDMKM